MRVIFGGRRIEFTTGYRIDVAKWDSSKCCVKNGCFNKLKQSASEINVELGRQEAILQGIFKEFEVMNKMPSVEDIKSRFSECIRQSSPKRALDLEADATPKEPAFWDIYAEFVKDCGRKNDWTKATYEKFAAFKNHLMGFKAFMEVESFDFFSETGLNDLVDYFRKECNMLNSTIGKQLGFLKWFLRWCTQKGYNANQSFMTFKPKLKSTQAVVIFLTDEEMSQLKSCQIPSAKRHLEHVRDVFLFCCYSGLRYSDVANLKRSDVKNDHIEVTTVKTADSLIIELNRNSRAILDKYQDVRFRGGKALPVISNQKMNAYIKELGALAGIDSPVRITQYKGNERIDTVYPKHELLSTHTGRKTFICKALALGIPPNVVMKWTGHSDYKSMKPYIDVADSIRAEAMTKFDDLPI